MPPGIFHYRIGQDQNLEIRATSAQIDTGAGEKFQSR